VTARPAPLALSLMIAAGCALSLAVLTGRPELCIAALPLLLALVPLARRAPAIDHTIALDVSRQRAFEGERVEITVTVTAGSTIALLELLGPRPMGSTVVEGHHRAAITVRRGRTVAWHYALAFPNRGIHDVGTIALRRRDRLGVRTWSSDTSSIGPCACTRTSRC
jgi:uncharacterized protein (DUF58 family)